MSAEYTYRRKLRASELMPAFATAFGLGLVGFYFVRLLLQRTPVVPAGKRVPPRLKPSRPSSAG